MCRRKGEDLKGRTAGGVTFAGISHKLKPFRRNLSHGKREKGQAYNGFVMGGNVKWKYLLWFIPSSLVTTSLFSSCFLSPHYTHQSPLRLLSQHHQRLQLSTFKGFESTNLKAFDTLRFKRWERVNDVPMALNMSLF